MVSPLPMAYYLSQEITSFRVLLMFMCIPTNSYLTIKDGGNALTFGAGSPT